MPTLLLRIDAPMQAWGTQSHFSHRDTGREPSKSGIIGLLCAALGRPRTEPIDDLASLMLGVRVDQPGTIRRDYHTAGEGGYYKVSGGIGKNTIPSDRFYLSDAKFLIGLEGEHQKLEALHDALQNPIWILFFGRKAFIPATRIWFHEGVQDGDLRQVLENWKWIGSLNRPPETLQLLIDDPDGSIVRNDHPISFMPRRFVSRRVSRHTILNPAYQQEE